MLDASHKEPYLELNNLDLLDERTTGTPCAVGEHLFDAQVSDLTPAELSEGEFFESPELAPDEARVERTLDEQYVEASDKELEVLSRAAFLSGLDEYQRDIMRMQTYAAAPQQENYTTSAEQLIEGVLPYIAWSVRERHLFPGNEITAVDRMQNGNLSVTRSAKSYDTEREVSLIAMIQPYLDTSIQRSELGGYGISSDGGAINYGPLIRVPVFKEGYHRIKQVHAKLNAFYDRDLELEELSQFKFMNFTPDEFREYGDSRKEFVSWDALIDDDTPEGRKLINRIDDDLDANPHIATTFHDSSRILHNTLSDLGILSPKQLSAVVERIGLDGFPTVAFKEVAESQGVACVSQVQGNYTAAMRKLRKHPGVRQFIEGSVGLTGDFTNKQSVPTQKNRGQMPMPSPSFTEMHNTVLGAPQRGKKRKSFLLGELTGITLEELFEQAQVHSYFAQEKLQGKVFLKEDECVRILSVAKNALAASALQND